MTLGTRILIVDDDADIRDGLSELLSDEGFEVATASNGQAAMDWLRYRRPESCVILLDLMMPVMDGRTFLRAKQSDPALSMLPVVIITAGPPEFDQTPDVRGCITKPIDLPILFNALAACSVADFSGRGPASGMAETG
jgi:CheY-like chemotaxis protein